ncbi:glycosyltransferase family protein [Paraburkholderia acidisoli]|uniref:Uncharacterized protein n=1 Tax=Paraburkholderia acidisoli TaxID=2571748 RepID=A0A7Z2JG05_9BURK|nr:hypothetical protein [Paraburkholderia acidisoli]QGZ61685.1 hypothetical protein FAZ98_08015 [Paraburkholderia acidisoli]
MPASSEQRLLAALQAHAHAPENVDRLVEICNALIHVRRNEQMLPWADKGLALEPTHCGLLYARAHALRLLGRHAEAAASWRAHRSLAWPPLYCETRLGRDLYLSGEIASAIELLSEAVRTAGDSEERDAQKARKWLAEALLATGDPAGFTHWLARNRGDSGSYRYAEAPMWNGQRDLRGERVLVTHQMGYGDQFLLYASLRHWLDAGATVMFTCDPPIHGLLQASWPDCTVVPTERPLAVATTLPPEALAAARAFAPTLQATLLHLPLLTQHDSTPPTPFFPAYLRAPEDARARAATWAQALRARRPGKRLAGLFWDCAQHRVASNGSKERCWAGLRSVPLAQIERLTLDPALAREVEFVSLHHPAAEMQSGTPRGAISHYGPGIATFADTAACLEQLDAVISVDAALANLGAMSGKPTAVLANPTGEWRWGHAATSGARSPWMTGVTVLRQTEMGDWRDVISQATGWLLAPGPGA